MGSVHTLDITARRVADRQASVTAELAGQLLVEVSHLHRERLLEHPLFLGSFPELCGHAAVARENKLHERVIIAVSLLPLENSVERCEAFHVIAKGDFGNCVPRRRHLGMRWT